MDAFVVTTRSLLPAPLQAVVRRVPVQLPRAAVVILIGALVASSATTYDAHSWNLWVIYGLLAASFTFTWGHAGIFSLGQVAFFGVGGYAYGVFAINFVDTTNETVSALVLGAVVAALFAAALGYFMFYGGVGDVYLAIMTLAVTLVLLTFMASTADPKYHIGDALFGGYNGMVGVPTLTLPGAAQGSFLDDNDLLVVTVVVATVTAFFLHWLMRRPFGRVVGGLRENEARTELLGYDVRRYKLLAFTLGGGIAGLAGGLYASWGAFINPDVFGLQQATLVAIWVLVGGRTSLVGAFLGAALIQGLSERLGSEANGGVTPMVLGAVLIAIVLLLPDGIVPTVTRQAGRIVRNFWPSNTVKAVVPQVSVNGSGPLGVSSRGSASIQAIDLRKQFGGVAAVNGTSLDLAPNTVHCLIGTNGAGKSTFFNLLTGRFRPTSGEVMLGGESLTGRRPDERARRGLGIKLQVPCIYKEHSVFENAWLAAYADVGRTNAANQRAAAVLSWLNLHSRAAEPAGSLSHGEQQWLEIAMVLAANPSVVLLDEPTAGMTREETQRCVRVVNDLARHATVIVVEHDMEFVRELAAPVTMFHEGRIFATGSVEELRADERVLDIYLGRATNASH